MLKANKMTTSFKITNAIDKAMHQAEYNICVSMLDEDELEVPQVRPATTEMRESAVADGPRRYPYDGYRREQAGTERNGVGRRRPPKDI